MDNEQWAAFNEQARETRAGLWTATVTIDGEDYEVSLTESPRRKEAVEGGMEDHRELAFELSKEDYETEPVIGDTVTYEEVEYTIAEVEGQFSSDPAWYVRAQYWED